MALDVLIKLIKWMFTFFQSLANLISFCRMFLCLFAGGASQQLPAGLDSNHEVQPRTEAPFTAAR